METNISNLIRQINISKQYTAKINKCQSDEKSVTVNLQYFHYYAWVNLMNFRKNSSFFNSESLNGKY